MQRISTVAQGLDQFEDEHESNILDLSAIDRNKLQFDKSVTNSNIHDIFIKSIPMVEDCELRFRRAYRHHAFKFDLGNITWAKVLSQPKSKSTTIAFVRFAQVALHPQIFGRNLMAWKGNCRPN